VHWQAVRSEHGIASNVYDGRSKTLRLFRFRPEVPRTFYFDPPNELIARDRSEVFTSNQYVTRWTPDGFDAENATPYTGGPVYYRKTAWNPDDQVLYGYKVN
jgi:hypothetical protein